MRASIYARISSDREGAGLGVAAQESDCRDLVSTLGATVVSVHSDNDVSAYSGKPRPGYRALLSEIEAGSIDAVIIWHTDRLHRSPRELEDYITTCEPRNVATHTVKAGPLDLATPSGRLVARQLGSVARYEIEHAVERMQRAKLRSAQAGKWKGGRRPFGYEPDGVTIRDSEAALIRTAADSILAGASVQSIAREWNAAESTTTTGHPWSLAAPRRILLRPRNAGLMEHRGKVVGNAQWEPILSAQKWEAVARVLTASGRRTNFGPSTGRWLGSGLYVCGVCGEKLRATKASDRRRIYRCLNGHVGRSQADLDVLVEGIIVERLRRPDAAELLHPATPSFDVRGAEARAVELRERLDQLAAMFADGQIDSQQLATGSRALNADLEAIRAEIDTAYSGSVLESIGNGPDAGQAWQRAPLDRKRAALDALVTVTVNRSPSGRPQGWIAGTPYFRPETVAIEWRA